MSSLDAIIEEYYYGNIGTTTTSTDSNSELSKESFLQLLVTQLQYQDPLDPVKNEDFVAQLAQFSSLEQMVSLNEQFEGFLNNQVMGQSADFIGKDVYWYDEDGEIANGVVDYVEYYTYDEPALFIGGYGILLSEVLAVGLSETDTTEVVDEVTMNDLKEYLGLKVTWYNDEEEQVSGIVDRVEILLDGTPALIIGEEAIGLDEVIAVETP